MNKTKQALLFFASSVLVTAFALLPYHESPSAFIIAITQFLSPFPLLNMAIIGVGMALIGLALTFTFKISLLSSEKNKKALALAIGSIVFLLAIPSIMFAFALTGISAISIPVVSAFMVISLFMPLCCGLLTFEKYPLLNELFDTQFRPDKPRTYFVRREISMCLVLSLPLIIFSLIYAFNAISLPIFSMVAVALGSAIFVTMLTRVFRLKMSYQRKIIETPVSPSETESNRTNQTSDSETSEKETSMCNTAPRQLTLDQIQPQQNALAEAIRTRWRNLIDEIKIASTTPASPDTCAFSPKYLPFLENLNPTVIEKAINSIVNKIYRIDDEGHLQPFEDTRSLDDPKARTLYPVKIDINGEQSLEEFNPTSYANTLNMGNIQEYFPPDLINQIGEILTPSSSRRSSHGHSPGRVKKPDTCAAKLLAPQGRSSLLPLPPPSPASASTTSHTETQDALNVTAPF